MLSLGPPSSGFGEENEGADKTEAMGLSCGCRLELWGSAQQEAVRSLAAVSTAVVDLNCYLRQRDALSLCRAPWSCPGFGGADELGSGVSQAACAKKGGGRGGCQSRREGPGQLGLELV